MTLGEDLSLAAAKHPEKIALSCGDETLTYGDFDALATRLARGFQKAGINKGDRVAFHMSNTIEAALCFYACFRLGAIAVPINTRLKRPEIEFILHHSDAHMYIGEPGLYNVSAASSASPSAERFYETSETPRPGFKKFASLFDAPESGALPEIDGADIAALLYTSGSTAQPKGVAHSHDSLHGNTTPMIAAGYLPDDVLLMSTSLAHGSGLFCHLLPAVVLATECALVRRFDAKAALKTIERRRCTAITSLPANFQALCREMSENKYDVSSVRICFAGGDSAPLALQEEFQKKFKVPIHEGIGMTEALPHCFNRQGRIRAGSLGEPAEGVEVRIVNDEDEEVAPGVVGEMIVRHPGTMVGYWNNPEATAAAIRDGWLYTGDLAYQDKDGYFWFAGRKKEIIVRGGSNISPQEVEDVLLQHPAVFQAGVIGMPDPELGESVIAFVSLRDGTNCRADELIEFAKDALSDHKIPSVVHFLDQMPLGATGKVNRRGLKETLLKKQAEPTQQNDVLALAL